MSHQVGGSFREVVLFQYSLLRRSQFQNTLFIVAVGALDI